MQRSKFVQTFQKIFNYFSNQEEKLCQGMIIYIVGKWFYVEIPLFSLFLPLLAFCFGKICLWDEFCKGLV